MATLRAAVYVAPPIPFIAVAPSQGGVWSPISCTLIYTATEAVLVDTPITVDQTERLVEWIKRIAPGRRLINIYVTHGHGDHFFGIPVVQKHFPEARPVATPRVIAHMNQQVEGQVFASMWEARFPGQIYTPQPTPLAHPLPDDNTLLLDGCWMLQAIECGHSDTYDSTILWVPELKLAVCGDVVYGQVHQMLFEANTPAKREEWIRAVEQVAALKPVYVVPGHKQAEEMDGVWHLAATKKYIEDFGRIAASGPKDPTEVFTQMTELYPDRFNPAALRLSSVGVFQQERNPQL
ncbi:Metallo-hydrolase/oxidoreductase [Aspergillus japonicus CBS 114.51]|uniref:Metallo-hydrolase/oxidoreductase n=1 Tax=Aspergillus japonicus CBS 114.51 TaxID=1448312 RepID=A0A8T8WJ01_ASPJA|nr:Metallo-hydrolase/oxidoreductase [Aspergillus japonicus CBS 114.51]RAH75741.1 Metallo-hydrolase/oxidoreductase [Aspergillus japonicus CBS 114.51]